jgi:asparagine synthetase B (glutamine-hydrolysing)
LLLVFHDATCRFAQRPASRAADDRLVADWGREGRHPFLDERVMALLLDAPLAAVVGA